MAAHSSVLAWRIPGTGEPGGLLSMGSHRVGHDWRDLAAEAAAVHIKIMFTLYFSLKCTLTLSKKKCLNSKIVYCLKVLTIPSEPLVSFNLLGGGFYLSVDGCWLISATECWGGSGTSYNKMTKKFATSVDASIHQWFLSSMYCCLTAFYP